MTKFIFVTGGVLSSLGKGILTASMARLLRNGGIKAAIMKIDPYLNCDAGTLNPYEHGEVFVTQDGFECDLDVGNCERFLDVYARKEQNMMMGSVYKTIVEKERAGEFLGTTVQLIPHATNEIKSRIRKAAEVTQAEVLLVEVGGTVGDIESEVVLEAARQMKFENGSEPSVLFAHLALIPTIITNEQKTKPMQHSVKALLSRGITPDLLIARSNEQISDGIKQKIALLCNVHKDSVFCSPNLNNIYRLPGVLKEQGIEDVIAAKLSLQLKRKRDDVWEDLIGKMEGASKEKRIAVVGKYHGVTKDTYMSIFEAIMHAGANCGVKTKPELVSSEAIEEKKADLKGFDAIMVPGGFGGRGIEGKIEAIRFARENKVPFLGICYGFQLSVVEMARNVLGMKGANTTEIDENTKYPVIDFLPEQKSVTEKGGTMRLGAYNVLVKEGTKAHEIYSDEMKHEIIFKRFRHRYEINPEYVKKFEEAGMVFSGRDPTREIMKIGELKKKEHPYFMGCQYHPEFDSRLERPEPLFLNLIKATL